MRYAFNQESLKKSRLISTCYLAVRTRAPLELNVTGLEVMAMLNPKATQEGVLSSRVMGVIYARSCSSTDIVNDGAQGFYG